MIPPRMCVKASGILQQVGLGLSVAQKQHMNRFVFRFDRGAGLSAMTHSQQQTNIKHNLHKLIRLGKFDSNHKA